MKATLDALDERLHGLLTRSCGRAVRIVCAALTAFGFALVMATRTLALGHPMATAAALCVPLAAMLIFAMRIAKEHEQGVLGALLLCALGAMSGRALLSTGGKEKEDHPYAPLFILLGVLMAASSFETADGFAPGRILSMLAVLLFAFERGSAFAIPAALCIGLGMDLGAGGGSFVHAASYAFSAVLVNVTARGNRVLSALWFALSILCFALPMNAHAGLVLLYEGLAATLLFLLIPSRFLRCLLYTSDAADE